MCQNSCKIYQKSIKYKMSYLLSIFGLKLTLYSDLAISNSGILCAIITSGTCLDKEKIILLVIQTRITFKKLVKTCVEQSNKYG